MWKLRAYVHILRSAPIYFNFALIGQGVKKSNYVLMHFYILETSCLQMLIASPRRGAASPLPFFLK